MTGNECKGDRINLQEIFGDKKDGLQELWRQVLQEVLEQEMTDAIGAEKGESGPGRLGYRSGYYSRSLVTRVGGKARTADSPGAAGTVSTQILAREQRSEKALVSALPEIYIQGVSTRKVKTITEALCGHAFSASAISAVNKTWMRAWSDLPSGPERKPIPTWCWTPATRGSGKTGVIRSQAV